MLKNLLMCVVTLGVVGLALAACGGSGKSATPTVDTSPVLHLGVADLTEAVWGDTARFLLKSPNIRLTLCEKFLAGSDLDAMLAFETNTRKSSTDLPYLTPVVADQEKAGKVLKETCRDLNANPPPAETPIELGAATPGP